MEWRMEPRPANRKREQEKLHLLKSLGIKGERYSCMNLINVLQEENV
jgi:hypothetical protein